MTSPTGADVLIVIPSINERAHITDVIATLQSDAACRDALIVVADDISTDGTVEAVQAIGRVDPRVHIMTPPRRLGLCASLNAAVRGYGAGRAWLVRIDAHAGYPPNYASRLIAVAAAKGATSVVTPMVTVGETCFQQAVSAASNSILGTGGAAHRMPGRGGWVEHGHHALMRLDLFMAVGGYDESFIANEDADLDARLIHAGGRIWLEDDLALEYYPRRTTRKLARQYFRYGQGRALTTARHGKWKLRQTLPIAILPLFLLAILTPVWPIAGLPLLAYILLCLICGLALIRPGKPCAAASGYTAIVMHLAWSAGYWRQLLRGRPGPAPQPLTFLAAA